MEIKQNSHKEPFIIEDEDRGTGLEVIEGFFNALGIMFVLVFIGWVIWYGINRQMKINTDTHILDMQLQNARPTVEVR